MYVESSCIVASLHFEWNKNNAILYGYIKRPHRNGCGLAVSARIGGITPLLYERDRN